MSAQQELWNKSHESIDFNKLALDAAKLSKAKKRKVGAVVVGKCSYYIGCNEHPDNKALEDEHGNTKPEVVHAEIVAINRYNAYMKTKSWSDDLVGGTIYVTHPPCADCQKAIQEAGITNVVVVEEFMKFDSEKLRYELIPTSSTKALAEVLTYGARKYKPENWRKGELDRYVGATMRHFEAWRAGEKLDPESGLPHLAHLLTNVAFLIELDS